MLWQWDQALSALRNRLLHLHLLALHQSFVHHIGCLSVRQLLLLLLNPRIIMYTLKLIDHVKLTIPRL